MEIESMELSKAQKDFIYQIVSNELSFSQETGQFYKELNLLKNEMNPSPQSTDSKYAIIKEFLLNPEKIFLRLESLGGQNNDELSIGLVKVEIIRAIDKKIINHANHIHCALTPENWNAEALITLLHLSCDFEKKFVSDSSNIDMPNPLTELPELNNKIYTRKLHFKERRVEEENHVITYLTPWVDVHVDLETKLTSFKISYEEFANAFATDEEQDNFFYQLKYNVECDSLRYTADIARDFLYAETKQNAVKHLPDIIATHSTYFDLIYHREIKLEVVNFSDEQLNILITPGVSALIDKRAILFEETPKITPHLLKIINHPVYYKLLESGACTFSSLCNLDEQRISFLIYPPIATLIQQKKLSLYKACHIPLEFKPIFAISTYQEYFKKKPNFFWSTLKNDRKDTIEYLKNKNIARLISDEILTFNTVRRFTPEQFEVYQSNIIFNLLQEGIIDKYKAMTIQHFIPDYLEKYPCLIDWLKAGAVSMLEIEIYDLVSVSIRVHAERIFNIFINKPLTVSNEIDDLNTITSSVAKSAIESQQEASTLWKYIIKRFLECLRKYLLPMEMNNKTGQAYYNMFVSILEDHNKLRTNEYMTFYLLQKLAEDFLSLYKKEKLNVQASMQGSIFGNIFNHLYNNPKRAKLSQENKELDQMEYICKCMKMLAPICNKLEENTLVMQPETKISQISRINI